MGEYDDLLYLPHPVSRRHPPMSAMDRAAQFSPFSALTGYEAVLREAGRLTDSRAELSEYSRDILDQEQKILLDAAPAHPEITVTYFIPDRRKQGGAYGTLKGNLKKIDLARRVIILLDGTEVSLDDVADIQGELFAGLTYDKPDES